MRTIRILVAFLMASIADAQTIPSLTSSTSVFTAQYGRRFRARINLDLRQITLVLNRPFSAEERKRGRRELSDGTEGSVTEMVPVRKMYRDSKGRTRTEGRVGNSFRVDGPLMVEVNDPANGVFYVFDDEAKVAYRVKYAGPVATLTVQPPVVAPVNEVMSGFPAQVTEELLPARLVEGIPAVGKKFTRVYEVRRGAPPLVDEIWTSPDIWITLLRTTGEPGVATLQLTGVSRGEPDPTLFLPPAGYRVVDTPATAELDYRGPPEPQPGPDGAYTGGPYVTMPIPKTRTFAPLPEGVKRISGPVGVSVLVGADGVPLDVRVTRSLDPDMDSHAIESVMTWTFFPGKLNGRPVPVRVTMTLTFSSR